MHLLSDEYNYDVIGEYIYDTDDIIEDVTQDTSRLGEPWRKYALTEDLTAQGKYIM